MANEKFEFTHPVIWSYDAAHNKTVPKIGKTPREALSTEHCPGVRMANGGPMMNRVIPYRFPCERQSPTTEKPMTDPLRKSRIAEDRWHLAET